jgi:hypothetical protein
MIGWQYAKEKFLHGDAGVKTLDILGSAIVGTG